jgi:hypothetical protein
MDRQVLEGLSDLSNIQSASDHQVLSKDERAGNTRTTASALLALKRWPICYLVNKLTDRIQQSNGG